MGTAGNRARGWGRGGGGSKKKRDLRSGGGHPTHPPSFEAFLPRRKRKTSKSCHKGRKDVEGCEREQSRVCRRIPSRYVHRTRGRDTPGRAGLLNTHRHVSKKVSTVDASFPHERSLPLVELLSDGSEVLGAKVRALKQAVQGVHATEQAHLLLMIQRSHWSRAVRHTRARRSPRCDA